MITSKSFKTSIRYLILKYVFIISIYSNQIDDLPSVFVGVDNMDREESSSDFKHFL